MSSDSESDAWAPDSPVVPKKKAATTKATKATVGKKAAAKPKGDAAKKKKAPAATKKAKAAAAPAKKKKKKSAYSDEDEESEDDDNDDFEVTGDSDVEMIETPTKGGKNPSIEQIYQKKTQLEHILLRPDTYIGSIEPVTQPMWVFDDKSKKMEMRKITYTPGLYKIFDEIIVNACDNKQRDKTMDTLKVNFDVEKGEISVWNNGKGIPVVMHKEHKVYVPELIFGHLLTGSNFDDNKKKTVGGRNGYGAKLANIFSEEFTVETADQSTKQKYKQVFSHNMGTKGTPTITPWSKKDYTCITFKPDLARFKMTHLDDDIVSLFQKRVYDVAGVTDKSLKVYLNDTQVPIKSFIDYVELYNVAGSAETKPEEGDDSDADNDKPSGASGGGENKNAVIFDKPDGRWHVGVRLSDDGFQQISFVNGICTTKGGQHVNYIADQIVNKLVAVLKKKNKGESVKPNYIKNHMTVYVSALIDNPAFDSQTKETLTTRPPSFGSTYTLSDKFLKQIEKSGMVERIVSFAQYKQTAELRRKAGGVKKSKLTGISKLDDANHAGSAKGQNCTLILTEGDSAKSLAISGLAVVGRDYYGVFPLKGKLLNVREASHSQIMKNEEIQNLVKIMGLKYGQTYSSTKGLRYGHLMIMADQDHDGSHIKGLVINFIHHFWPSLLQIEGFLQEFITPIVKCTKARTTPKVFYTMPEYEAWRESTNNGRGWNIKYYKGLGTSTGQEAKEYFSDLQTHQIGFVYNNDADGDSIDMAFSKKRVEERKDWLRGFEPGTFVDYDVEEMAYTEFVNKELILFSMADNLRSIPSVVDGFKPSQRKVLFSCFKRNLKTEIKVVQLAGYVSEHSAYHHGEASLQGTIVNMAQDFVGSNNIHLLSPNGQFGTRILGGKDAASARYIFTNLEALARRLFDTLDNDNLKYLDEDGQSIEPEWYVPIIPMVLVNGSEGIGTGWSSSIPNYNPLDIIRNIRHKLKDEELEPLSPWYRGFTGTIREKITGKTTDTFVVQGVYEVPDESTLVITELPVKTWTHSYKQFLESLLEAGTIKDFRENHTDSTVLFTITLAPETLRDILKAPGGVIKKFKLENSISTSNMHLFDASGHIKKYETPQDILEEFYDIRLEYYEKRKISMLARLAEQIKILSNKTRFILAVVNGKLVINNRKKDDLIKQLVKDGYDQMTSGSNKKKKADADEESGGDGEEEDENSPAAATARGYDYLLSMKLLSLTKERVEKLQAELNGREDEYRSLDSTPVKDLWVADLDHLEKLIIDTEEERKVIATSVPAKKKGGGRRKAPAKRAKKRKSSSDDDSDDGYELEAKPKVKQRTETKVVVKVKSSAPSKAAVKKESTNSNGVAAKPISAFFAKKEDPPAPKTEKKDDIEVMSLAERLARRVEVTPKKDKPAKTTRPTKPISTVNLASSDDEDAKGRDENSAASDDDVFAMSFAKKPAAKKAAPVKKAATKSGSEVPMESKTALKRKEKTTQKAEAPASKKQKKTADDSEEEEETGPLRRGGRVRARITYTELSSDDEEEEENQEEDEDDDVVMVEKPKKAKPAPKSKAKKRIESDEDDEASGYSDIEDDDSE